jgi:hypothetical protein
VLASPVRCKILAVTKQNQVAPIPPDVYLIRPRPSNHCFDGRVGTLDYTNPLLLKVVKPPVPDYPVKKLGKLRDELSLTGHV